MVEKRRFHRVGLAAKSVLTLNDTPKEGVLENISLNGALVRFKGSVLVAPGTRCVLAVYLDGEDAPLLFIVEVVHCGFAMVGVKFTDMDAGTKGRLQRLMKMITPEPEKLRKELKLFVEG